MNLLTSAFLAAYCASSLPQQITASRTDADNLHIGCWDDQFNGTASSHMLVTPDRIVISYDAYPPYEHDIVSDYTSFFSPENSQVDAQGVSFIASNDPDGDSAGLFSDFDMMIDSSDETVDIIYYCQIDYNDPSAVEAAKEDEDINYADLGSGCNGYAWSKMRRADNDEECKDLIVAEEDGDDHFSDGHGHENDEKSVKSVKSVAFAMSGSFATAAIMAMIGIIAM